jgi:sulfur-carrier protein
MMARILIPLAWSKWTNHEEWVEISSPTVGEALKELQSKHPALKECLVDDAGNPRRYVNVFVNQEDIRFISKLQTPLHEGDELCQVPAIVGG